MAGNGLTPEQVADLAIRRRQINERHGLGLAQQDYLSNSASNEHGRQLGQLTTDFTRMLEKQPWKYAARGMLNSGIYQHDIAQRAMDFNTNKGNLQNRLQDTLAGYRLSKDQQTAIRTGALSDISQQQQAAISSAAAAAQVADSIRQAG